MHVLLLSHLSLECHLQRYGSAVARRRGRGSECSRPGYGISPREGGSYYPHHIAARTYTKLGNQTLGGHQKNVVCPRTQKKGAVTPQETAPDLPMSVQESGGGMGWRWPAAASGARSAPGHGWHLFLKEVTIISITSTMVWPQVEQQGGDTAHQRKIRLNIY